MFDFSKFSQRHKSLGFFWKTEFLSIRQFRFWFNIIISNYEVLSLRWSADFYCMVTIYQQPYSTFTRGSTGEFSIFIIEKYEKHFKTRLQIMVSNRRLHKAVNWINRMQRRVMILVAVIYSAIPFRTLHCYVTKFEATKTGPSANKQWPPFTHSFGMPETITLS